MALSINLPTDFGVDAAYWNIGSRREDYRAQSVEVTLYGYVDEAARLVERNPISTALVQIDAYAPDMDRAAIYAYIKTTSPFSGAKDA